MDQESQIVRAIEYLKLGYRTLIRLLLGINMITKSRREPSLNDVMHHYSPNRPKVHTFVNFICCFTSIVNSCGHVRMVSYPNHNFFLGKLSLNGYSVFIRTSFHQSMATGLLKSVVRREVWCKVFMTISMKE